MALKWSWKPVKLVVICIAAALMNIILSNFFKDLLGLPLYLDTVFSAAVAFAAGLIPGIAVAILNWLIASIYYNDFHLYVLCVIAEVVLICALKPAAPAFSDFAPRERIIASYTGIAAKLLLLYILCAITISVLGGIINYVSDVYLGIHLQFYSVEDTFKLGLIMNNLPDLAVNIFSRIQVNIVDRFIVIFGGYFISRGLGAILAYKEIDKNPTNLPAGTGGRH